MTIRANNQVIILGSGTSSGIPTVGCFCSVCISKNPKNKRTRTSIYLKTGKGLRLLVDTTPDLRTQLLQNKIHEVDDVIITHEHADHIQGLDDLRPLSFFQHKYIPVHTSREAKNHLVTRFSYIFSKKNPPVIGGGRPLLKIKTVTLKKPTFIQKEPFDFFLLPHGYTRTLGFIHRKLAFITDCSEISEKILDKLKKAKLDIFIIDCVRKEGEHRTHLTLEKILPYIDFVQAKFTGLIHMGHDFDHEILRKEMKRKYGNSVAPLYDGQKLYYR